MSLMQEASNMECMTGTLAGHWVITAYVQPEILRIALLIPAASVSTLL